MNDTINSFFFLQAEDGLRDATVTGVQTCALPILLDNGRDVVILDRDEETGFGGLAKESFGGLFFVNSREQQRNGIKDSPAQALRDWHSFAEFGPADRFPKLWAETYVER